MPPFRWNKGHAIFLPELDAEHREIFRLAADFQHTVESGADRAGVLASMQSLATGLEEHFAHEERLMKDAACPSYEWHRGQHNTARKRAKATLAGISKGNAAVPGEFLEFLAGWIKDHVAVTDRMMSAQVKRYSRSVAS